MSFLRRRKRVHPGFEAACAAIDDAQRSLLAAIPTSRNPGTPLAEALAGMNEALGRARATLETWDHPAQGRCLIAVDEARERAAALRLSPERLDFESLNVRVGDVLHPLEAFAEIEWTIRRS